jgi:hypothetical protein
MEGSSPAALRRRWLWFGGYTNGGGADRHGERRKGGVLERAEGNISAAARELGVHRTQLRRWMERHGLDARAFAPPGRAPEGDD